MDFIEELKWRGMLHDATPGIETALKDGMCTGYIGFDPTAPSLTLGNYVQIMLLTLFQRSGHKPIVLMGGATGRIGDPSGKDKERQLKSYEELDENLKYQSQLFSKFLNFETGKNKALMVNNYDFYKDMNVLAFLRDVGKTITVSYMSSKESVKKRVNTGMSFTEFSYQLLQGYDFQCLYEKHNCTIQMGGSDQWGNITTGTEFIRRNLSKKAYAVTTPLLTKSDGTKFGKSEKGNVWIDEKFTSPFDFYQFWINADDADVPKFIRYFTLKSKEEVEAMETEFKDNPRALKEALAEEITSRVYSEDAYKAARNVAQILFNKKANRANLLALGIDDLAIIGKELQTIKVEKDNLATGANILNLLSELTDITKSKSEARRAIKGNAISINKEKVTTDELEVSAEDLLHDKYLMIENGKKHKFLVEVI